MAETTEPKTQCCCRYYHEAVELIGKRWTGAIVAVLLDGGHALLARSAPPCPTSATACSPSA